MRVLILGAGVVGTTAAWFLHEAGHEVTVIDRQTGPALETSFANGGQVAAAHAEPWANPATPGKLLKWIGRRDAPLYLHWWRLDPALWAWGLRFLANCRPAASARNLERVLRIAAYSRAVLKVLRDGLDLQYDQKDRGVLHIHRDPRSFDIARRAHLQMVDLGLARQELDPAACLALEPALADAGGDLCGGFHSPDDESGDAHAFTCQLAKHAAAAGVVFRYGVAVRRLLRDADRLVGVVTDAGVLDADAVVLSLGSFSRPVARTAGVTLPIMPAKGYSITVDVGRSNRAPVVSITDDAHKLVFSRLGNRLRAAGTAETAGLDPTPDPARLAVIRRKTAELFPTAGDVDAAEGWAGLRPTTPDSVPIIGSSGIRGLWLNTGHGTLGWTMACGSGRMIADMMSGRTPEIATEGLGLDRFQR